MKLTAKSRAKLPAKAFGEPGSRKYPMPDKGHAVAAKARATQQVAKGNLAPATKAKINSKADRVLGKGAMKGHEHVMQSKHFKDME